MLVMPDNEFKLSFAVSCLRFDHIHAFVLVLVAFVSQTVQNVHQTVESNCLQMDRKARLTISGNCHGLNISAFAWGAGRNKLHVNFSQTLLHYAVAGDGNSQSIIARYRKLEMLDLSINLLVGIPDFLPETLRHLNLSGNRIVELESRKILFIDSLESLYIDDNLIRSIGNRTNTGGSFWQNMHLSNLKILTLRRNFIRSIDSHSFRHLIHLRSLSLTSNRITSLQRDAFEGLTHLVRLDLSDNLLQQIESNTFLELTALTYLNLGHNRLAHLPKGLPMAEWLDVSYNLLHNISEDFKPEILAIEFTNFAHNPLLCDCNMLWLKEAFDRREYIIQYLDVDPRDVTPSCGAPEHLASETWDVLSDDVFICKQESETRTKSENPEPELLVKGDVLNESSVALVWKFKNLQLPNAKILISYYVFGLKSTTMRHVKVLETEKHYVLGGLSSQTNYMICVDLAKPFAKVKVESLPILLNQCIEVTTKVPQPQLETTFFAVYWWYSLTMIATFVTVIGCIVGLALLCSLLNRRHIGTAKSTYPVDEPLSMEIFPDKKNFLVLDDLQQS